MTAFEKVRAEYAPCLVIVGGDVNSALARAFVAAKLQSPVAHAEAGLLAYLVANLAVSMRIAGRAGWRHFLRLPLVFTTLHLAYGLGFWAGMTRFGLPRGR